MRLLTVTAVLVSAPAGAFQIDSPIHNDCHERFTMEVLSRAQELPGFPARTTEEDRMVADLVQFDASRYGGDLLTLSLILGARYNDIRDNSTLDLGGIVPVHNVPQRQREHCLRRSHHDGEIGLTTALAECTGFIRELVVRGTRGRDLLDPWDREDVDVYLRYRGSTTVKVSRLYFNLGRAVHVVQDSFSHTVRSKDGRRIVDVCNWIDDLGGSLEEPQDGCKHLSILDNCECSSPAYDALLQQTVQASVDFFDAVLTADDVKERDLALQSFFERWMQYQPGCTPANLYCDNQLLAEVDRDDLSCPASSACNVNEADADRAGWWPALLVIGLLVLVTTLRRRALLVLALVSAAGVAEAADKCAKPEAEPGLYLIVRNGISSDRPALAFEGGALWRGRRWGVGLFADYNPFLSFERGIEATSGAFNIASSGTVHFQLTHRLSMRFEARVGLSVLLFRSPGYDVGNVGLFLGLRALGLDYQVWRRLFLHVDPIDVGMPIFKVDKLPFYYKQWRVSGGLGWRFL